MTVLQLGWIEVCFELPLAKSLMIKAERTCEQHRSGPCLLQCRVVAFRQGHVAGQYADDTTLCIGCNSDWMHYQNAIDVFCDASGMTMNWDKSLALWLGSNITNPPKEPPNTIPNGLSFIPDKILTRILGARMGTNIASDSLWNYREPKIQSLLESKLNHSGDELRDTLIAKSIITGELQDLLSLT